MNAIELAVAAMKLYQDTYPEDAYILVVDTEKIVAVLPGQKIDFKLEPGTPLSAIAGTVIETCVRIGKPIQEERGPEQYGIGRIATAVPLVEDGKVVGALAAVVSNQKYDTLRSSATELAAMVEQMSATTEEVARASAHIADLVQDTAALAEQIAKDVENIESMATFVQHVASQSNLLGLNAAIEAARAGEHGRGFSVVANEIRKMADQSTDSAKQIQQVVQHIRDSVQQITHSIQEVAADTEEHTASLEELKAAYEHIAATADTLVSTTRLGRN